MQTSGGSRREIAMSYPDLSKLYSDLSTSLRGALATKQAILSCCSAMDCFAGARNDVERTAFPSRSELQRVGLPLNSAR